MADTPTNLHALTLDAIQALDFSRPGWAKQMDAIIARGHTAAALAATADRAGVKLDPGLFRGLSRAERKDIDQLVRVQRQYLANFVAAAEGLSEAQIAARAGLYAGAVRQTYYSQRWGDWIIPPELLPGNQTCITNCKCRISVRDNNDGTGELTREMGGTEDHCDECPALVGTYPVKRQNFTEKDFDGWDDSEIDSWGDEQTTLKHGHHDQSTHGRRTGRRVASRAAYSASRAGGASIQDSRIAAHAASDYLARAQRIENITKQQAGHMSPAQRRSTTAELQRLADAQDTYLGRVPAHLHAHVNDAISRAPVVTPTVRGRADPKIAQAQRQAGHSQEAKDAHAKVIDAENTAAKINEGLREKRRALDSDRYDHFLRREDLARQRNDAIAAGDDVLAKSLQKDIAKVDRQIKKNEGDSKQLLDQILKQDDTVRRNILMVDKPGSVKLDFSGNTSSDRQREIELATADAMKFTSTTGLNGKTINFRQVKDPRAYAVDRPGENPFVKGRFDSGDIGLHETISGNRTIVHEVGHHIEFRNPEVKARANAFLDRRTAGETPRPLAEITNNKNYHESETAAADRFISAYMGKRYDDGSTEIISMGLEYFYSDPLKLAKDDPDYFMFMYDVLRTP